MRNIFIIILAVLVLIFGIIFVVKLSAPESDIIKITEPIQENAIQFLDITEIPEAQEKKQIINEDILFNVPFIAQAPFGNWKDDRQEYGCEEASALMAMRWVENREITLQEAEREIITISEYELKNYGNFHDTSAHDTVERIFKDYFKYEGVELKYEIDAADIKEELKKGNLIIAPVNGQKLGNPFYTPPGPIEHQILIIGYNSKTKEFIVNDPGTKRGAQYRYKENVIENAMQDYPTGFKEPISEIIKAIIIVKPLNN